MYVCCHFHLGRIRLRRKISFYLRACSVVIILVCRAIGSALADPLEAEDPPPAENNLNIYISAAF